MSSSKIKKGFDRDVDLITMKDKLIKEFIKESKNYLENTYKKRVGNILIYLLIELIQLRNGSRVCEAIDAFRIFLNEGYNDLIEIKIAKSEATKIVKDKFAKEGENDKKQIKTKPRYRKMMFPIKWINNVTNIDELFENLKKTHDKTINNENLRIYVAQYMNKYLDSNTHSLRYAFINYMIDVKKKPLNIVARFIGHANINQLIIYTQQKKCDKIFEEDF